MAKRVVVVLLAGVLALVCGGGVVAAEPAAMSVLYRYPGSVRTADEGLDLERIGQGMVTRQAVYQTSDELAAVQNWYADRLQLAPASILGPDAIGCTMMNQADLIYHLEHALTVVLCARPYGTQVVVNEKLAVLR